MPSVTIKAVLSSRLSDFFDVGRFFYWISPVTPDTVRYSEAGRKVRVLFERQESPRRITIDESTLVHWLFPRNNELISEEKRQQIVNRLAAYWRVPSDFIHVGRLSGVMQHVQLSSEEYKAQRLQRRANNLAKERIEMQQIWWQLIIFGPFFLLLGAMSADFKTHETQWYFHEPYFTFFVMFFLFAVSFCLDSQKKRKLEKVKLDNDSASLSAPKSVI